MDYENKLRKVFLLSLVAGIIFFLLMYLTTTLKFDSYKVLFFTIGNLIIGIVCLAFHKKVNGLEKITIIFTKV